jgi:hypothetical protein
LIQRIVCPESNIARICSQVAIQGLYRAITAEPSVRARYAARDLLTPVYRWFNEGFDTFDLKEAKTLLDELQA